MMTPDGLMDGPTDGLTKRGVESRSTRLKKEEKEEENEEETSPQKSIFFADQIRTFMIFSISTAFLTKMSRLFICQTRKK